MIFFCFMINKHGHTSLPKHDYFLFQEILTQETKKLVHVIICPLILILSFFLNFFCLDEFRDHPTSVGNDKLGKSTQRNDLCLSIWVMLGLTRQILHSRKVEG